MTILIKSYFIFILLNFISTFSHAQILEAYQESKSIEIDSLIGAYSQTDKLKYLSLLPSISYDALNNAFNVGFSLNNLSVYFQNKQRNKIELARLEQSLHEELANDLDNLSLEIETFETEKEILKSEIELFKYDFDLFEISRGKYQNNEISSEEFIKLKRDFLSKKNSLKTAVLKLKLKEEKIFIKTKSADRESSLDVYFNLINNFK